MLINADNEGSSESGCLLAGSGIANPLEDSVGIGLILRVEYACLAIVHFVNLEALCEG